jgi:exo-beta-1,3-glucanase (GH17 family)
MIKGKKIKRLIKGVLLLLFAFIITVSQSQEKKSSDNKMNKSIPKKQAFKQSNDDLLAGLSRAVCYSGFRSGQHPDRGDGAINPSYDEVLEDLKIISEKMKFSLIRIYDCGENSETVLRIIRENNLDIKVLLGIWLRAELSNHETCEWLTEPIPEKELEQNKLLNLAEIRNGINLANAYKDVIVAVNVGNEALVDWNDHKVDTDTIISYVQKVQSVIEQPVTVADNYKWWADHGAKLAKVVDFVSLHIYPVWENLDIDEGLSYSILNFEEVRKTIPDSRIVITEAGWPSVASEFGERASEEKQKQYFREFMTWSEKMNITTFWFEAFDEDWKGDPDDMMGAEKHWGLYTVDRKPKKVMQELVKSKIKVLD